MTAPDTGGTISGASPREDVPIAGGPEMHVPGQPPGMTVPDPSPNILYTSSKRRAEVRAAREGRATPQDVERSTPPQEPVEAADTAPEVPADSAPKAQWVEYAVSQGADRDTADGTTKQDLVCQYKPS